LAAQQLDQLWDGWMASLSTSYEKTMDCLAAAKPNEAREEFRTHFQPAIKKLFSEAADTYPVRFAKSKDWCTWTRNLLVLSTKTEKSLAGGAPDAAQSMASLREHFYKLHEETDTRSASDLIYALHVAAARDRPSVDELKSLRSALSKARPSARIKANPQAFAAAHQEWDGKVDAILKDGAIDSSELAALRAATDGFYRAFGMQFE
jgi:hypothetical protein